METEIFSQLQRPLTVGIVGDFHGSSKRAARKLFLEEVRPVALLQVGDLQDYDDWPVPTLFVHGNHESYQTIAAMDTGDYVPRNLVHLLDAQIVELGGLRISGLGGVWLDYPSSKALDQGAYEELADLACDIVMTHDTPIHFRDGQASKTCEPLRTLCQFMAPRFWFSGHHHYYDEEWLGQTQIVSLGKFPHEWGVLEIALDGSLAFNRFVPFDRPNYDRQLLHWREMAKEQKDKINSLV